MRRGFTTIPPPSRTLHVSADSDSPERFVIVGDHNADPVKGDSFNHAINQILRHPRVDSSFVPSSSGGGTDTADFASGRLRVDYVLPSKDGFDVTGGGVFWPLPSQPGAVLLAASDHRLVWLDVVVTPFIDEAVKDLRVSRDEGDVILAWETQDGVIYLVERSVDLVMWQTSPSITVLVDSLNDMATAVDAGGAITGNFFYRVVAEFEAK